MDKASLPSFRAPLFFVFCFFLISPFIFMAGVAAEDVSPPPEGRAVMGREIASNPSPSLADPGDRMPVAPDKIIPHRLDLQQSVDFSLANHPDLAAWRHERQKSLADKKIATANMGPSLDVSANSNQLSSIASKGPTDTDYLDQSVDSVDISITQPIFKGFSGWNMYKRTELQERWVELKMANVQREIVLEVQTAFLKLLQLQDEVRSLQETVSRLKTDLQAADAFHKVKMAPYIQVLQAGVDLADAQQRLSKARSALRTQVVRMNILVGLPADTPTSYAGRLDEGMAALSMDMPQCLDYGLKYRPDLIAARVSERIASKDVDIANADYYPTVEMAGRYVLYDRNYNSMGSDSSGNMYDRDQKNEYWSVGLNLRWNLFESGRTFYNKSKYRHEVNRQKELIAALEDQIHAQVRTYFFSMTEARARIDATRQAVTAAQENYDMARKRYKLQLAPHQEVLNAQERLSRSEANLNQALADYKISLANLYFSMGLRNPSLDPTALFKANPAYVIKERHKENNEEEHQVHEEDTDLVTPF